MADVTLRLDGQLSLFAANHSLWPQLPQSMWRADKHNQLMNALDFQVWYTRNARQSKTQEITLTHEIIILY